MKKVTRLSALVAAGVLLSSSSVFAADLMEDRVVEPVQVEAPIVEEAAVEVHGSMKDAPVEIQPEVRHVVDRAWYLRGDIGYAFTGGLDAADELGTDMNILDEDDGLMIGGGIGYDFGSFRTDLTVDHVFDRDYNLIYNPAGANPDPGKPAILEVSLTTVMANLYYDFDMGGRFTPYVGAGVGLAYAKFGGDHIGGNDTSFAWSLMGGLSMKVSDNLDLDLGYRWMNYGDLDADSLHTSVANPAKNRILEDLDDHQIRVGLRYTFGSGSSYAAADAGYAEAAVVDQGVSVDQGVVHQGGSLKDNVVVEEVAPVAQRRSIRDLFRR